MKQKIELAPFSPFFLLLPSLRFSSPPKKRHQKNQKTRIGRLHRPWKPARISHTLSRAPYRRLDRRSPTRDRRLPRRFRAAIPRALALAVRSGGGGESGPTQEASTRRCRNFGPTSRTRACHRRSFESRVAVGARRVEAVTAPVTARWE